MIFSKKFFATVFLTLCASTQLQAACSTDMDKLRTLLKSNNETIAFETLEQSAMQGDPFSQFLVGEFYWEGTGVQKNHEKSGYWTYEAALQGVPASQFKLGAMYDTGQGMEKDVQKALHWYLKASMTGHGKATYNLGNMYERGQGTEKDYELAYKFYLLSSGVDEEGTGKRAQAGLERLSTKLSKETQMRVLAEALKEQKAIKKVRAHWEKSFLDGRCVF